jgi:hypothetical protein
MMCAGTCDGSETSPSGGIPLARLTTKLPLEPVNESPATISVSLVRISELVKEILGVCRAREVDSDLTPVVDVMAESKSRLADDLHGLGHAGDTTTC